MFLLFLGHPLSTGAIRSAGAVFEHFAHWVHESLVDELVIRLLLGRVGVEEVSQVALEQAGVLSGGSVHPRAVRGRITSESLFLFLDEFIFYAITIFN
jgi:hypothetical protein